MALTIELTNGCKKDLQKAIKQRKDISKFLNVSSKIACKEKLPTSNDNHKLEGIFEGHYECHIEPDWLLIYYYKDANTVVFTRLGSHSELFG